ncbi:MAG TPA: glycosyltransferase [Bryobacteraceae bacterium]|jgi:ceramide glucosyltransferase|nr:glycosyltransferase [Bryobacteraceae bacterium]
MLVYFVLGIAATPAIYYLIALYSSLSFFLRAKRSNSDSYSDFTPPVSLLKPIRGLDPEAYENFASFCRQDYPQYEILFCVDPGDPAIAVLEKLKSDYPQCNIRLLLGSGRQVVNDKVGRLVRLTHDAQYELFVITDSDVRVEPNYLRSVVRPFLDPKIGAATCFYASTEDKTLLETIQSISMMSDFFAGILVAWKLDGVKFALAQTIVTRRQHIAHFGGYEILEDRPADDLYIGRLVAEQGLETLLLPYVVRTVPDFESPGQFFRKRVRWMTVMRHMRPAGHFGLLFTWGLPWCLVAIAVHPTVAIASGYLGCYLLLRVLMTWLIGIRGMKQAGVWKKMALIPVWDLISFTIWMTSFGQTTIRWRGVNYLLRNGKLILRASDSAESAQSH